MGKKRSGRRLDVISDQDSPISNEEQARLLNDPAIPLEHAERLAPFSPADRNEISRFQRIQGPRGDRFYHEKAA